MTFSLLTTPCEQASGIGKRISHALAKLGINTLQDVLFHLPLRYQDRTHLTPIRDLRANDEAVLQGTVTNQQQLYKPRLQLIIQITDGTGNCCIRMFYFNNKQKQQLKIGTRVVCYGEVRHGRYGLELIHPEYHIVDSQYIPAMNTTFTPVYPSTEGVSQTTWRRISEQVLNLLPNINEGLELIPVTVRERFALPPLIAALQYVHRPPPEANLAQLMEGAHPTQQRLAFEELLAHQLSLRLFREQIQKNGATALAAKNTIIPSFISALPFKLTHAQRRVFNEVATDMSMPRPMLRLVQGDVGSGKTVIAALAMLLAVENGWQATMMAPTEILAEQHYQTLHHWLGPLGVEVGWLTGKLTGKAKTTALKAIESGKYQIVVGTHALFQKQVNFAKLGLIVVDEQHRFGVEQRLALRNKGNRPLRKVAAEVKSKAYRSAEPECTTQVHEDSSTEATQLLASAVEFPKKSSEKNNFPHQLIMTATPIPRTLTMTAYADLDVSIIDELPPGRKPVNTVVVPNQRREEVIEKVKHACERRCQVYWVCTLIDESEQLAYQAAETTAATLQEQLGHTIKVSLIHGRLTPTEKENIMQAFKAGEVNVLVATTVIEVGVDVPNASLMIIENPERLGLSQLHQLRGRVGRGHLDSFCVLLYQAPLSEPARERLAVMRETNDGFIIAERDLTLRGPGEILGTRQTGVMQLRIADLRRDNKLLPHVQQAAAIMQHQYPTFIQPLIQRWIGMAEVYGYV